MASRDLRIVITGDTRGLERALKGANAQVTSSQKHLQRYQQKGLAPLSGHMRNAAKAAVGLGAAFVSIGAAKKAIATTENLAKTTIGLHRNFGLAVGTGSALAAIMESRGANSQKLGQSLTILSKNVSQAEHGSKSASQAFKDLGITHGDLAKGSKNLEPLLFKVADRFGKMKGSTERAALAQKLFGRGYKEFLPLLSHGSKGLRQQIQDAKDMGASFSGKGLKGVEAFVKSQRKARLASIGLQIAFGTQLAPALTKVINRVADFVKQVRTGHGAGGQFAATVKRIWSEAKPVVLWFGRAAVNIGKFASHHKALVQTATAIGLTAFALKKFHVVGAAKGIGGLLTLLRRVAKTRAGEQAASEIAGGLGGASRKARGPLSRFGSYLKRVLHRSGGAAGARGGSQLAFDLAGSSVGGTKKRAAGIREGLKRIFRRIGSAMGVSAAASGAGAIAGEGAAAGVVGKLGGGKPWKILKGGFGGLGRSLGTAMGIAVAAGLVALVPTILTDFWKKTKKYAPKIGGTLKGLLTGHNAAGGRRADEQLREMKRGGAHGGIVTPTGIVRGFASGGVAGLDPRDTVPAMLRPGEGILTPEAVRKLGGPATVTVLNSTATNKAAKPSKRAAPLNLAAPMDDERKDLDKVLLKVTKSLKTIPDAGKKQSQLTAKNVSDHLVRGGKNWVKAVGKAGSGIVDRFSDMRAGGGREARKLRVGVGSHFDVMRKYTAGVARGMASSVVSTATGMRKNTGAQARGLRVGVGNHFEGLRKNVRTQMRGVADHTQNGIQAARKYASVGAKGVRNTVASSYSSMDTAVFRGIGYVSSATSSALKGLGGKGLSFGVSRPKKLAVGGMISGAGRQDTVPIMAAPGEAILNRHQQPIVESALANTYGIGLNDIFERIRTPHYMAKGGKVRKYARGGLHPGIARAVSSVLGHFPGLQVTSTTGGGHARGSYHYKGEAADISGSSGLMFKAANWIKRVMGRNLTEGIHNPNLSIKFGKRVSPSFWGGATWAEHANHIHLAVAGMLGALGGLGGGGAAPQLKAPRVSGRGPLAEIARRALGKVTGAANNKISQSSDLLGFSGGGSDTQNMALGRKMMLAAGWPASQWPALKALWIGESGWRTTAGNPSSGAYGIPQSLPASKMASAGGDYRTNPATQIRWGLKYIRSRYGSPAAALHAWQGRSPHWYRRGGFVGGRRKFGYGGFTNRQLGLPKKATNKQARQRFLDMRALGLIGRTTLPGAKHPGPLQILTGKGGPVGNQIHAQLIAGQDALIIADADLNPNDANSIHAAQRIEAADRRRVNYWRGRVAHFQKMLRGKHLTPYARQGAKRELRHALDMLGSSTSDATSAIEDVQSRKDAGADTSVADLLAAQQETNTLLRAQNGYLDSVERISGKVAAKALSDLVSGQAGYRTTQRMRTPNAGAQLARY